jgi:hypothetical protein
MPWSLNAQTSKIGARQELCVLRQDGVYAFDWRNCLAFALAGLPVCTIPALAQWLTELATPWWFATSNDWNAAF